MDDALWCLVYFLKKHCIWKNLHFTFFKIKTDIRFGFGFGFTYKNWIYLNSRDLNFSMYTNQWNKNQMFTLVYLFKTCPLGMILYQSTYIPHWVSSRKLILHFSYFVCSIQNATDRGHIKFYYSMIVLLLPSLEGIELQIRYFNPWKKIVKSIGERKKFVNSTCEKCLIQKKDLHRILLLNRYVQSRR